MSDLPVLVQRFQRCRWGEVRIKMDRLNKGDSLAFPLTNQYSVKTTVARFNYAWDGIRQFSARVTKNNVWAERIK
jgi:hypothetical protein